MTLKYRGISYQANCTAIATPKTQVEAKYRGQSYQLHDSQITPFRPNIQLIYRGVPYNLNQQAMTSNNQLELVVNSQFA